MNKPRGWDKMEETSISDSIKEFSGDACSYLVPWVDESSDRADVDMLIQAVRDYITTTIPNVPDSALEKLTFGQIVCEGVKRVQSVYTNDPNRWPKGDDYKVFVKALNVAIKNQDMTAASALKAESPDLFAKWNEAEAAKDAIRNL